MSLNKIVNPMLNQQLNITVQSVHADGPLTTTCTLDQEHLLLTPQTIGSVGQVLTRISGNTVAFLPPSGSGGTVTNPLGSNLNIGSFDVTGLDFGQTLNGMNLVQQTQTPLIDSMVDKTQNFNASLIGYEYTVLDGVLRSTTGFAGDQYGSPLFQSKITMTDASPNSIINVVSDNFQYNGNPIATVADIQTTTLSSVGTGDSIVYNDVGPSLSVKSLLQGDGIQVFSFGTSIEISNTDHPKTQNQSAILNDTTFTGIVRGDTIVKNGGTSIQYLMADGSILTQSAVSGNSNFFLYNSHAGITTPPPADGQVAYNNTLQASATLIYISHITSDNLDIEIFYSQISQLNDIYLQDRNNSINFIKYNITSAPTIISNSYISIPVSIISFGGNGNTSFGSPNHPILVSFFTNNLETDTRISAVETKTQNQTSVSGTTTFSGIGGVISDKFIKTTGGLSTNFWKTDGSVDTNLYALNSALTTTNSNVTTLQNKTFNMTAIDTISNTFSGIVNATSLVKSGGLATEFLKANGTVDSNTYALNSGLTTANSNITTLQDKTQNQTATTSSTTFTGTSGITADKFIKTSGLSTEFLKANGTVDSNTYIQSGSVTNSSVPYINNLGKVSSAITNLYVQSGVNTIQSAIDAVAGGQAYSIQVSAGSFTENLVLSKLNYIVAELVPRYLLQLH